jgi:hypothetical protein
MKQLLIVLLAFLILGFLGVSAFGETGNPYPPPRARTENGMGPSGDIRASVPSGGEMIADLLLVRPFAIAAYLVGIGVSVVATPFAVPSGTTTQVTDKLLKEPFDFAFRRPLGEF